MRQLPNTQQAVAVYDGGSLFRRSQRKRAKQNIAPLPQDDTDDATFRAEWKMSKQQEVHS